MGTLAVTTYKVSTNRSRTNANAHRYAIQLQGTSESGPATSAVIYFWPTKPADTVGYLAGSLVVGLLDDSDFAGWYDILRHEKPIRLYYVENSAASENRLWHISIGTADEELVGEGPRDYTP